MVTKWLSNTCQVNHCFYKNVSSKFNTMKILHSSVNKFSDLSISISKFGGNLMSNLTLNFMLTSIPIGT